MTVGSEDLAGRRSLQALLGNHPSTYALRQGMVTSDLISLAFADVAVPNTAFKRVVRDLEFDLAELALMTFLMARSRNVPLRLLPVVVFSRNPLPLLICDVSRRRVTPEVVHDCRIGVRSYTTTTAVWLRALFADQCGAPLEPLEWMTLEEGHVANVPDPPSVRRHRDGTDLTAMLRAGVIDAAIVDPVPAGDQFVSVIPDPQASFDAWQRRFHAQTVNHVIVVRESLAEDEAAMRELFRLFCDSRAQAGSGSHDSAPIGFEANRRNLEVAIDVASVQGLLARPLTVDDLVTDVLAGLN